MIFLKAILHHLIIKKMVVFSLLLLPFNGYCQPRDYGKEITKWEQSAMNVHLNEKFIEMLEKVLNNEIPTIKEWKRFKSKDDYYQNQKCYLQIKCSEHNDSMLCFTCELEIVDETMKNTKPLYCKLFGFDTLLSGDIPKDWYVINNDERLKMKNISYFPLYYVEPPFYITWLYILKEQTSQITGIVIASDLQRMVKDRMANKNDPVKGKIYDITDYDIAPTPPFPYYEIERKIENAYHTYYNDLNLRTEVSFVIEKDGSIGNVSRIEISYNPIINDVEKKACLKKIIMSQNSWSPAIYNGKKVRSRAHLTLYL